MNFFRQIIILYPLIHHYAWTVQTVARIPAHIPIPSIAAFIGAVLCLVLVSSCDESLPPRDNPHDYLNVSVTSAYYTSRVEESIYFTVYARNVYSEMFSDTTDISGTLTIQIKEKPEFVKTFPITAADFKKMFFDPATGQMVTSRSDLNPYTKVLTIPENGSAPFQFRWNLLADDSTDAKEGLTYKPDPRNPDLVRTEEITIIATAVLHLYERLPLFYPLPLVFKQSFVRPRGTSR